MKTSKDDIVRAEIAMICTVSKMTKTDLAKRIGVGKSSFFLKYKDPSRFSLGEIRSMKVIAKGFGLEVNLK